MMENKVIVRSLVRRCDDRGMTQFVNEARADDDATRPAVADMGFKEWGGTVAGAISCLTTNAFTMK